MEGLLIVIFTDVLAPVKPSSKQPTSNATQKVLQDEILQANQQIQSLCEEMQST
ncbi:MAG: chemotaxis protein methyltransferase CheR/two-component system CheB/CheR fusion protein [Candidatus Azotimanducaceae bacterium]